MSNSWDLNLNRNQPNHFWRILSHKDLPFFEVLLGLIILSEIGMFIQGGFFKSPEMTRTELNLHRMIMLKMSLQAYRWANNSFPPDLGALVCEGQDTRACISVSTPDILQDPWGRRYLYRLSGNDFTIKSLGADKREGGDGPNEDVTLWGP
ncbi:MAG: type II secretion system protein GspG [Elusimicrobia bacterium]|nr:type II secretion system protein GspG [Candidatus Obscuribacterium magneticum]